ncbi:TAXI family TRAP transporter solute-binding subunit [Brevibacterium sp.]|nr:TAXI family TRAP transporter solute-binding subunit [Brevibacterium sp.]
MRIGRPAALLCLALVLALSSCTEARRAAPAVIATGPQGGVYHALGTAFEEVSADWRVPLTALASGASVANLEQVGAGEADLGFALADIAALAVAGDPPFDSPQPISALAKLYDNHTHLIVQDGSEVRQLADLGGALVALGPEGSGTELMSGRLLETAGLMGPEAGPARVETVTMDLLESTQALAEGEIDALFWSSGIPAEAVTVLAETTAVRLIDLSEWVGPLTERYGGHYAEVPVPVDAYPGVPGVRTVGVASLLVAHSGLARGTVDALTEDLFASREALVVHHPSIRQLSERAAIGTLPVPLHPGAADYFKRVKTAQH